ncbi:MAG: FecR domain-containing protein [Candidatus Omnitrophica bacterium]|nr:FecR domain-containing protein [Candidatus Omnitrophota bacterium]
MRWTSEKQIVFNFIARYTSNSTHILMAGGALLAILLAVNFLASETPDRARIVRFEGGVVVKRGGEAIVLSAGMLLNPQDEITTSKGAYVEVAYDDVYKDIMRIGADTRVFFESNRIQKDTTLFMDKGEIKLKLDNLEKGSTFKVRTPVAIAGVRGTAFAVKLDKTTALITDYESRIFVKGLTEDHLPMQDELLLTDGWKAKVVQFEKPQQVQMLTVAEKSRWKAWLNDIDALPRQSFKGSNFQKTFYYQPLAFLGAFRMKISSSPSVLALMLYGVLALGAGKVVERVWL